MLTYEGRHQITLYKQCVRANCAVKTETAQGAAPAYAFMLSCEDCLVWGRLHAEQLIAGALANVEAGRGGQSREG